METYIAIILTLILLVQMANVTIQKDGKEAIGVFVFVLPLALGFIAAIVMAVTWFGLTIFAIDSMVPDWIYSWLRPALEYVGERLMAHTKPMP